MEDKYYLPKIEEFHVGFEYEQHEIINERDPHWKMMVKKMGFSKKEINQIFYNVDLIENLDQKRIRVKYLDRSDIESLGFKVEKDDEYAGEYYFSKENSIIGKFLTEDNKYNIELFSTYFIVKNKSEFKKLLIQLDLINE